MKIIIYREVSEKKKPYMLNLNIKNDINNEALFEKIDEYSI